MIKVKTFSITAIVAVLVLLAGVKTTMASPTHDNFGSFDNESIVPSGSNLILDIIYKVTNDEDTGLKGYWALLDYNKHIQAWEAPDNAIYFVVSYLGNWETFDGALSPQNGEPENNGSGTFKGGYTGTCMGTFTPGDNKTNGNIGSFDYGGTQADVEKGTYGNGQGGDTDAYNYIADYFTNCTFTYLNWGWTYDYKNQTWNNFQSGNSGDIVVP